MTRLQVILVLILSGSAACTRPGSSHELLTAKLSVNTGDSFLKIVNGRYFYKDSAFTGTLNADWTKGMLRSLTEIENGRENGPSETFYISGKKESLRYYKNGEKDSVHCGWWENGNKKFEYHFKMGNYHGLFTEWYASGKKIQEVMYADGKELYGKGWRESGQLYLNFVMKNGRLYGMNNSNLCYKLSNGAIEEKKY